MLEQVPLPQVCPAPLGREKEPAAGSRYRLDHSLGVWDAWARIRPHTLATCFPGLSSIKYTRELRII